MSEGSFGRYRLESLLGEGGMGQVYRAFDTETHRTVALKLLPPNLANDADYEERFRREAKIAALLSDPHIVPIHNFGEIDGRLYVDMRLIEGRELSEVLRAGALSPDKAVLYIEQIAEALHAAHRADLVHRDVKPSNVLVTDRDFVYLIDFGIAQVAGQTRITRTGLAIGTFAYIAPERLSNGTCNATSDVYSLTCVLYECLTGRTPFAGEAVEQLITAHLVTAPPKPSALDRTLAPFDRVIAKGMAKNPARRYQTTFELADAARTALGAASKPAAPDVLTRSIAPNGTPRDVFDTVSATNFAATALQAKGTPDAAPRSNAVRRDAANLALQRRLAEREAAEVSRRRRRRPALVIGSVFLAALVATLVAAVISGYSADTPAERPTSTPNRPAAASAPADCVYPSGDVAAKSVNPPTTDNGKVPTEPAVLTASLMTNRGAVGLQLDNARAPCTVNSFISLASQGFFDDTPCHRLTNAPSLAVLQCGDPTGTGTGGPGYTFANEYPTSRYPPGDPALSQPTLYKRGTIAMANSGPDTNGSQFFLVLEDSQLPPQYTMFGTIDEPGLTTLDKIAAGGITPGTTGSVDDGSPAVGVRIESIRID